MAVEIVEKPVDQQTIRQFLELVRDAWRTNWILVKVRELQDVHDEYLWSLRISSQLAGARLIKMPLVGRNGYEGLWLVVLLAPKAEIANETLIEMLARETGRLPQVCEEMLAAGIGPIVFARREHGTSDGDAVYFMLGFEP